MLQNIIGRAFAYFVSLPQLKKMTEGPSHDCMSSLLATRNHFDHSNLPEALKIDGDSLSIIHHQIEWNGVKLHVVEAGKKDGAPVILLHGYPEFWWTWVRQINVLAKAGYHVLAPDLPGMNSSEALKSAADYDVESLAKRLVSADGLMKFFGHKRAHFIGHDWGGVLLLAATKYFPEAIDKLIVSNSPHPAVFRREYSKRENLKASWHVPLFKYFPEKAAKLIERRSFQFFNNLFHRYSANCKFPPEEICVLKNAMIANHAALTSTAFYRESFKDPRHTEGYTKAKIPTLFLWAKKDPVVGENFLVGMDQFFENMAIHILKNSGHWGPQEAPEEFNRAMLEFLHS